MWKPYGNNIQILPQSKNKIIGDTSKFYLFGDVIAVGEDVTKIKPGDRISYTLWGVNEVLNEDGTKRFLVQDNPDFILEVLKNEK